MGFLSSRRARVLTAAGTGLALVAGGIGWSLAADDRDEPSALTPSVATASPTPRPRAAPRPKPKPTPKRAPKPRARDPLTGGKPSSAEVFAVKIENTPAARPQVGLGVADVVVVQEVESSLTRLVALYHSDFPRRVGPVRSARTTDAQLLPLFGKPGLVYSGANRRVQRRLERASLVPLPRSTRDPSRVAPHNVMVDLRQIAKGRTVGRAQPTGWTFADNDARWAKARRVGKVTTSVGGDGLTFAYGRGRYLVRWQGQTYGDGAKAVRADNVVVLSVDNRGDGNADVNGSASVLSPTVGRGKVVIYRDGRRQAGTWTRKKTSARMRFRDAGGRDIPLAPGQTWLLLRG